MDYLAKMFIWKTPPPDIFYFLFADSIEKTSFFLLFLLYQKKVL
jgi:hypothetical protein